jgi:hypothetical protein
MYPAAKHNTGGVVIVALTFGIVTIITMLVIIAIALFGVSFIRLGKLEKYNFSGFNLILTHRLSRISR